jgi:hypothetical protein
MPEVPARWRRHECVAREAHTGCLTARPAARQRQPGATSDDRPGPERAEGVRRPGQGRRPACWPLEQERASLQRPVLL